MDVMHYVYSIYLYVQLYNHKIITKDQKTHNETNLPSRTMTHKKTLISTIQHKTFIEKFIENFTHITIGYITRDCIQRCPFYLPQRKKNP